MINIQVNFIINGRCTNVNFNKQFPSSIFRKCLHFVSMPNVRFMLLVSTYGVLLTFSLLYTRKQV